MNEAHFGAVRDFRARRHCSLWGKLNILPAGSTTGHRKYKGKPYWSLYCVYWKNKFSNNLPHSEAVALYVNHNDEPLSYNLWWILWCATDYIHARGCELCLWLCLWSIERHTCCRSVDTTEHHIERIVRTLLTTVIQPAFASTRHAHDRPEAGTYNTEEIAMQSLSSMIN